MAMQIVLPKLGFSVNEATINAWLVEDGATVTKGQPLYEIESEKSVQEIEAPADGTLRILKPAGEIFEVGTIVAEIE